DYLKNMQDKGSTSVSSGSGAAVSGSSVSTDSSSSGSYNNASSNSGSAKSGSSSSASSGSSSDSSTGSGTSSAQNGADASGKESSASQSEPGNEDNADESTSGSDNSSASADLIFRIKSFLQKISGKSEGVTEQNLELTPESNYQLRYFSVIFDKEDNIISLKSDHISSLTENEIRSMASRTIQTLRSDGLLRNNGMYYSFYRQQTDDGNTIIVFMDTTSSFRSLSTFANYSFIFGILCTIAFLVIVTLISRKVVQPIAKNIESQKQFITNAGHELKTPLAVISANAEVLEMMEGKNEWTTSIRNQVVRLTGLVNNLIRLAKMQETSLDKPVDVNISAAAKETADSYRTIIEQKGKHLKTDIAENLHVMGDPMALPELINILVDNATKYCNENGTVSIHLKPKGRGKGMHLIVTNTYAEGTNVNYDRFFDRFYREDTSHNSKKSGYGIGLSMASQIVENNHGKIYVTYAKPDISFHVVI
ncbi:MAG: sensor histidine kinase, partial [Bilifractor sp.]